MCCDRRDGAPAATSALSTTPSEVSISIDSSTIPLSAEDRSRPQTWPSRCHGYQPAYESPGTPPSPYSPIWHEHCFRHISLDLTIISVFPTRQASTGFYWLFFLFIFPKATSRSRFLFPLCRSLYSPVFCISIAGSTHISSSLRLFVDEDRTIPFVGAACWKTKEHGWGLQKEK